MEIEVERTRRMKLAAFADEHGLKMKCVERTRTGLHRSIPFEQNRWYAHFTNAEVKEGACLAGISGNGATQAQAMKDYARRISGQCLVIDAFRETRREIYAPELF